MTDSHPPKISMILCCMCGVKIEASNALGGKCSNCLAQDFDPAEGVSTSETLIQCPECQRYKPSGKANRWLICEPESAELLALCLKRVKGLASNAAGSGATSSTYSRNLPRLKDAKFIWQEEHNRRVKVQMQLQRDTEDGRLTLQKTAECEFVIHTNLCPECSTETLNRDTWTACIQVRQNVAHKRTMHYLENELLKKDVALKALNVEQVPMGIDLFFSKLDHANKFADAVSAVVPAAKRKESKQLVNYDLQNNEANFQYTIMMEVVPICKFDLCVLPLAMRAPFFGTNKPSVCLCTSVSQTVRLLDYRTFEEIKLSQQKYFTAPFTPISTPREATDFLVLDVLEGDEEGDASATGRGGAFEEEEEEDVEEEEEEGEEQEQERERGANGTTEGKQHGIVAVKRNALASQRKKYPRRYVEIARLKDIGENDERFMVETHLGHLLKEGDIAMGYEVRSFHDRLDDKDASHAEDLPDIVLFAKKTGREAEELAYAMTAASEGGAGAGGKNKKKEKKGRGKAFGKQ